MIFIFSLKHVLYSILKRTLHLIPRIIKCTFVHTYMIYTEIFHNNKKMHIHFYNMHSTEESYIIVKYTNIICVKCEDIVQNT